MTPLAIFIRHARASGHPAFSEAWTPACAGVTETNRGEDAA